MSELALVFVKKPLHQFKTLPVLNCTLKHRLLSCYRGNTVESTNIYQQTIAADQQQ